MKCRRQYVHKTYSYGDGPQPLVLWSADRSSQNVYEICAVDSSRSTIARARHVSATSKISVRRSESGMAEHNTNTIRYCRQIVIMSHFSNLKCVCVCRAGATHNKIPLVRAHCLTVLTAPVVSSVASGEGRDAAKHVVMLQ